MEFRITKGNALAALLAVLTSGCVTANFTAATGGAAAFDAPTVKNGVTSGGSTIYTASLQQMAPCKADGTAAVTTAICRNYVVGQWMAESESKCDDYLRLLMTDTTNVNLGLGWTGGLLSGLSTVFTHTGVVKSLAGAGSIVNGAKSEYDADVIAKQTVSAITGAIRVRRNQDRVVITSNLNQVKDSNDNALDTDDKKLAYYPLSVAAADVLVFHSHCSLNAGLEQLQNSNQAAQEKTDQAQTTPAGSSAPGAASSAPTLGSAPAPSSAPAAGSSAPAANSAAAASSAPSNSRTLPGSSAPTAAPAPLSTPAPTAIQQNTLRQMLDSQRVLTPH
jgi:hypothetical protein